MSDKTSTTKAQVEMSRLKQLCTELKVDPREARKRLRLAVPDPKKNPELAKSHKPGQGSLCDLRRQVAALCQLLKMLTTRRGMCSAISTMCGLNQWHSRPNRRSANYAAASDDEGRFFI